MWRNLIRLWKSDNLLDQAWTQSFQMLAITHQMFHEAMQVLRESESPMINKEIREKDRKVNIFQQDVRRKVIMHCAVQGTCDMASALVLVSIVIDIERIGDYTKNIVDLAAVHPRRLTGGPYEESLAKIESAAGDIFDRSQQIIEKSEDREARRLLSEYIWVNPECDQRCDELVQEKHQGIRSGDAATLVLYFRSLKRINSHLRNILTGVVNPFDRIGFQPDMPKKEE